MEAPPFRVSAGTRIFGALGLAAVLAIAGFGDQAAAAIVRYQRAPRRWVGPVEPIHRVFPSPDGRWVAIDRIASDLEDCRTAVVEVENGAIRGLQGNCLPVAWSEGLLRIHAGRDGSEARWIDPRTGRCVREERIVDLLQQGFIQRGDGWSERKMARNWGARGRWEARFRWAARDWTLAIPAGPDVSWGTTSVPGVVFHSRRQDGEKLLLRTDLEGERELARLPQHASWIVSPDAACIAVAAQARIRVYDALDGAELGELPGEHLHSWVGGSRWLAVILDGCVVLHDLATSSARRLFDRLEPHMYLHALPGDRILAQREEQVLLYEKESSFPRQLFPLGPDSWR